MSWWVGVDVGGTFTDLVAVDTKASQVRLAKVPTTLPNQADGIMSALAAAGAELADVEVIVHGTTTGTNAVLERKGAVAGLVTTQGFRDVLELGRRTRPQLYGLGGVFEPLIPRNLRLEVAERVSAHGDELTPLDEDGLRAALAQLAAVGCESVAISFVNSYVAPEHEQAAAQIARSVWPNEFVSVGSELLPQIREFERTTTAALNALLQPLITRYTDALLGRLAEQGYRGQFFVTQANGGVMAGARAGELAVHTVLSGPAAGVTAAAHIAARAGFPDIISGDMGGTSFDVATVRGGRPALTSEKNLAYKVPLRIPAIDIATIGAGGGSIAWVDRSGILRVGPQSAGSFPGPVVYGRGGVQPTLTDANAWLGRLDQTRIPGVQGTVSRDRLEQALRDGVAAPLGISVDQAAAAIVRVANDAMAGAVRLVSIERGADPREFAFLSFGGAGPLHAVSLAAELGIPSVIVPRRPGLTSALGCLVADVRHDHIRSIPARLSAVEHLGDLSGWFDELEAEAARELSLEGMESAQTVLEYRLDMQYEGQFHVVTVRLDKRPTSAAQLVDSFEKTYAELFGATMGGGDVRVSSVGVSAIAVRPLFDLAALAQELEDPREPVSRRAWFDGSWREVPVIDRLALDQGTQIQGPAIIEQGDSTLVLEIGAAGVVDADGNLIITVKAG